MIGETAAQRGWLSNHAATVPHQGVAGDRPGQATFLDRSTE